MGAYPALSIRPLEDNSEGIKNAFALKGMLQNQQMQGQQMQLNQLNIEKQKQAEHDRQAVIDLYKKHQGNTDKIVADAPNAGISPEAIQQLQLHSIEEKKNALALVQAQGQKAKDDADLFDGAVDIMDQTPEAMRPKVWQRLHSQLAARQVDMTGIPAEYPGPDGFALLHTSVKAHTRLVDEASKAAGLKKTQAETAKEEAETGKIKMQTDAANPTDPDIQKAKYQKILQQIQTNGLGSVNPTDYQWARSFENAQKKTTTQSDSLGISSVNTSGPSGLAASGAKGGTITGSASSGAKTSTTGMPTLGPKQAKEGIVDQIGNYKMDPMMLNRLLSKHGDIPALIAQKYPDWDQTTYAAKNAFIKGLTSGHDSKALDAINTAMGHLKNLDDAVDALNNGNITLLNKIGRIYNVNVAGKTAEAAFKLIANRVGTEVTSAYVPGGGGEKERIANQEDFSADLPPQTLHNNAAITANMLRSKIGSMENRYKQTMQRDDFDKYITPEAKAALAKFGQRAAAGNAEIRTYQGHTYAKGTDGQWHLQQ